MGDDAAAANGAAAAAPAVPTGASESLGLSSHAFGKFARMATGVHEFSPTSSTPVYASLDGAYADRNLAHGVSLLTSQQDELKRILRALELGQSKILGEIRQIHDHMDDLGGKEARAESRGCRRAPTEEPNSPATPADTCFSAGARSFGPAGPCPPSQSTDPLQPPLSHLSFMGWSYCGFEVRQIFQGVREEAGLQVPTPCTLESVKKDLDDTLRPALKRLTTATSGTKSQRVLRRFQCLGPQINPIHPDSVARLWLDVAVITVLIFDSMSVPFQLTFKPDTTSGFFFVTNWMTMLLWTMDLCVGFSSGYYENGRVVMNFRLIAGRYLRTFFAIDVLAVGCDWLSFSFIIVFAAQGGESEVLVVKLLRILKLNRLFRLAAALQSGKFGQIYDRILNVSRKFGLAQQLQFVLSITQLTFSLLWLNHIGSCMWFAIFGDASMNWMRSSNILDHMPDAATNIGWEYVLGFYWSMTSMVSGASIMAPTNVEEMVFTILYVLFGLLVGSTLISSLAAMLLDIQMTNKWKRDSIRLLRQYLYQEGVDVGLSLAVEQEAMQRMSKKRQLGANEVDCLHLLSPELRSALNYATHSKPLKQHSFFGTCHILDRATRFTKEICEGAVQHHIVDPGAKVFDYDDETLCEGSYYVVMGQFEYRAREQQGDESAMVAPPNWTSSNYDLASQDRPPVLVGSGQWLCEMAVWLKWRHRGSLDACLPCEFFRLAAQDLLHTLAQHADLLLLARFYAHALCKTVQNEESRPLTDLPLRDEIFQVLVRSMPQCGRQIMSIAALKLLQDQKRSGYLPFGRWSLKKLVNEVELGQCDLVIIRGKVLRVVSVVALELQREVVTKGGVVRCEILVRLGKSTNPEEAQCQLPGGKVQAGELPSDALARILRVELAGLGLAGLRQEDLQKADDTVELMQDAVRGSRQLRVSLLSDLSVGSMVRVDGEGHPGAFSETQEVAEIDFDTLTIGLGSPLKYSYAAGSRVTKAAVARWRRGPSADAGVETKYIRSVFCGRLSGELPAEAVSQLRRSRPRCADSPIGRHDPTNHSAFVLLSDPGRSDTTAEASAQIPASPATRTLTRAMAREASARALVASASGRGPRVERRAPYAWVSQEDFRVLSATPRGQGLVQEWVAQLARAAGDEEEPSGSQSGDPPDGRPTLGAL